MVFNSLLFVYFFVVVTSLYFILKHKYRWPLLLMSSCYFYMAFVPIYILILGFTVVIDYFAGIYIDKHQGKKRKWFLIASLIANIGVLAMFKYYNFLNDNLTAVLGDFNMHNPFPYLAILLPIGLSFHTFQAMSYTIEVYRGNQKPERNFGIYALYVMFYPQLVAGPIERPQNVIHQFHEKHTFKYDQVSMGLKIMLWGFFKKIVIADRLAIYVNAVYNNPTHHSAITLFIATVLFTLQLYCDFSGYSDIAIGAARVMGFKLMTNFRRPFLGRGFADIWSRWHLSLTTWFRDYLYFPLGGNRGGMLLRIRNLYIVYMISGLWHGASWNFVIWGFLHCCFLVLQEIFRKPLKWIVKVLGPVAIFFQIAVPFLIACIVNVFFRARTFGDSWYIIKSIFTLKGKGVYLGEPQSAFFYSVFAILALYTVEICQEFYPKIKLFNHQNVAVRYTGYALAITILLMIGVFNGGQFVYFQF
ncbi:MAG: MBOAT family O-acyltransferase [Chitinophagaceae bacterium]